jgi:RNA polymerase sigma-70 factor (ECF subfamily)
MMLRMQTTMAAAMPWAAFHELAERGEADEAEPALVRASLAGDERAYGGLVRRYQTRIFRLLGRFFRRPEDVEEAAQEAFLRAWQKLDTFRATAPFEHWLVRIALRCAFDRLRRMAPFEEPLNDQLAAPAGDPDARLEVEGLLARLAPADRFLLVLLEEEGWAVAEVAAKLGWSRVNVKVRAHRARRRLRRLLEEG